MNTQTDFTLSDIENFEVYKDWYVKESWTAFAELAKFRKDILREVKNDYIKKSFFKISKKKSKASQKILGKDKISKKRMKTGENSEKEVEQTEGGGYKEAFLRNSLQKTCEITIKTNRTEVKKKKKAKEHSHFDTLQEFSCQAYMQVPVQNSSTS